MKLKEFTQILNAKGQTLSVEQAQGVALNETLLGVSVSVDMSNPLKPSISTKQTTLVMLEDGLHAIAEPKKSDDPFAGKTISLASYPDNYHIYLTLLETIEVVKACLVNVAKQSALPSSIAIRRKNVGYVKPFADIEVIRSYVAEFADKPTFIEVTSKDEKTPSGYLKINGGFVIKYPSALVDSIRVEAVASTAPIDLGLVD